MRKINVSVGSFIAAAVIIITFSSWGFLVHKTVQQIAIYELPGELRQFFYKNMDSLVYHSVRADVRRGSDSTEAPKHFMDFEAYGDSAAWKVPLQWNEAVALFTEDTLNKYGYVPYVVVHIKQRLTEAFRNQNADSVLFYAADLGHYIADANVPLHTSINHDGQLTGQRGLHSLWESMVPEVELNHYNLFTRHKATYLNNPAEAIMVAMRRAHGLLPSVFAKEREVSYNFTDSTKYRIQMRRGRESRSYTSEFAKAYGAALQPTINDQLIHSANLIADFWYTSWIDAGKPDLNGLMDFTKTDKKALRKEVRTYRNNCLIECNLLQSRKPLTEKIQE